jgi:predicted RNase H-like HicB family nuclease
MAHGSTQIAALENVNQTIELWLDSAREFNDPIPEPKWRRLLYA